MPFMLPPDPDEGPAADFYTYTEGKASPVTAYNRDGIALTTTYQVDWILHEYFCARLLGSAYYKNNSVLTRRLPHKYPPRGGRTGPIYCVSASAKPWPEGRPAVFPGISSNLYQYAQIDATYSSLDYIVGTNPLNIVQGGVSPTDMGQDGLPFYTTIEFETASQSIPLGPQTFQFATVQENNKPKILNTQLPYPIPTGTLHITRHWVPFPAARQLVPLSHDIESLIGTTNAIPLIHGFFAVETLEYLGAKTRTVNTPLGDKAQEQKLSFKYYPRGVNQYPIADPKHATAIFDELRCAADPTIRIFKAEDWSALWA